MIVFDTETTGLPAADAAPLAKQPHIIEFAAIKLDEDTLEEVSRLEFLSKPPIDLPPIITKITGITDADLGTTTVYSVGATVFQNLTAGDCLYESTTAGAVCVRCSGGQLSGVDFVASTTSTSPCSGGTPYKLWEVSGGCLIGSYTCIGA